MIRQEDQELPPLDGLAYKPQKLIDTGSKMSDLLLAQDRHHQTVALKIACVDQRARADVNRLAIKNTIEWLRKVGNYRGIVALRPIEFDGEVTWRSWWKPPIYSTILHQWPGQPECLVMEYIGGGSLRDFVGDKRLDIALALWIAHYIARALAYIHQHGCVHRDIKPENVLFRVLPQTGVHQVDAIPILIDFGVAARRGADRLVSGSRLWMAPELQAAYEKRPLPVDPSWDVYALGLILCYLLTGRRPRHRNYDLQDYEEFRERTFVVLDREMPETDAEAAATKARLKRLLANTLAKTPDQRPTAQAFAAETAALLADLHAPLPAHELWRMRLEQSKGFSLANRHWLRLVAALVLVFALLLLAGFAAQRGQFFLGFAVPAHNAPPPTGATTPPAQALDAGEGANDAPALLSEPTQRARLLSVTPTAPPTLIPGALATAPTLAPFTPVASEAIPTLAAFPVLTTVAPPTLVPFTPTATATPAPPTETPTRPTPIATPTFKPRPTLARPFTPRPTAHAVGAPTATATPAPMPLLGRVGLLSPATGARSGAAKVTFTWEIREQPLAADQCFELVFWAPNQPVDQRSPVGAGKAMTGRVDFHLLASSQDALLHRLAQAKQPFHWGVRIISCANPAIILKPVEQVRVYTYDGQ
ncbi:MAG: protein kinase [Caldilineaceae bacterium]